MTDVKQFMPSNSEIKFVPEQEPWTVYKLENGATVKVRVMLVRVKPNGKVNKDTGKPEFELQMQQVVDVSWD